jgi:hypothetical protein
MNIEARPKFKSPPNLTAPKMRTFLERYVDKKIPGLLENQYV